MRNISEEETDFKKKVGDLGMFMIDKAQQEINETHRKTLFQKVEIRKEYLKKQLEGSSKIKTTFIETYTKLFNNYLSSALLSSKEKIISLKNDLLGNLKITLHERIIEKINNNYSGYIEFLLDYIYSIRDNVDNKGDIIILLNSKDYNYFNKDINKIDKGFKNSVTIKQDSEDFIGGFKVTLIDALISYDYTIEMLVNKNYTEIEIEFSKLISEIKFKELNLGLEKFIELKKNEIEEHLKNYD